MLLFSDPPGRPEIQGLDEGEILTAGKLKRLTCISMSGNPLAKLTWYVGVRQVASVYSTVDNYATAELALIPDQVKDFLSSTLLALVSHCCYCLHRLRMGPTSVARRRTQPWPGTLDLLLSPESSTSSFHRVTSTSAFVPPPPRPAKT